MGITDDVKRMRDEGLSDNEILNNLINRGFSQKQISDALSQAKIKEAVNAPPALGPRETRPVDAEELVPSMMMQESEAPMPGSAQEAYAYPEYGTAAPPVYQAETDATQAQVVYPAYTAYQPQQQALSTDTITEISEQVVLEKLSPLRVQIEKVLDLKTTLDSRIEFLDERLKRIETIIDRLQLSILQKVGEYATGMEDVKKELIETQKSFKALLPTARENRENRQEKTAIKYAH